MKIKDLPFDLKLHSLSKVMPTIYEEILGIVRRNHSRITSDVRTKISKIVDEFYGELEVNEEDTSKIPIRIDFNVWNSSPESHIGEVHTDGQSFASTKLILFKSQWSRSFAHGADSLISICALVDKILQPEEKITEINQVSWKKPMQSNISMLATSSQLSPEQMPGELAVEGSFSTSTNRNIYFYGVQDQTDPILYRAIRNPNVDIIQDFSFSDSHCYRAIVGTNDVHTTYIPSTLVELVTLAVDSSFNIQFGTRELALLASISSVRTPANFSDFVSQRPKIEVKFDIFNSKEGKSGMTLMPFDFSVSGEEGTGLFAFTTCSGVSNKVCVNHY